MSSITNIGGHAETVEEAIKRLLFAGKIDIHAASELMEVWQRERYYAQQDICNRKIVFDAINQCEAVLNAIEKAETKHTPLLPPSRVKKEKIAIANARIASYRNCDRFDDVVEMRKAYFEYQDKVLKENIKDAKPVAYDSWMLGMADK